MGDSGSLIIGAVVSVLAIQLIQTPLDFLPVDFQNLSTPVFAMSILSYPLLDTLRVFIIRAAQGRSPLSADRNHLHHKLMDKQLGAKRTVLIIYSFNTIMIVQAFFFRFDNPNISFVLSLSLALIFALVIYMISKKTKG